jgi:hypothetical protein
MQRRMKAMIDMGFVDFYLDEAGGSVDSMRLVEKARDAIGNTSALWTEMTCDVLTFSAGAYDTAWNDNGNIVTDVNRVCSIKDRPNGVNIGGYELLKYLNPNFNGACSNKTNGLIVDCTKYPGMIPFVYDLMDPTKLSTIFKV